MMKYLESIIYFAFKENSKFTEKLKKNKGKICLFVLDEIKDGEIKLKKYEYHDTKFSFISSKRKIKNNLNLQ